MGDVLVVQFDDDELDESDELYSVLRDSVARRQAEGEVEGAAPAVRLARLGGTHLTPLTQDIFLPAEKVSEYASAASNVSPVMRRRGGRSSATSTRRGASSRRGSRR